MPWGNKPLPEPVFDPDVCHHMPSLGHDEFIDRQQTITLNSAVFAGIPDNKITMIL